MSAIYPAVVEEIYHARVKTHFDIPLYTCPVSAGFPSPADEYLEGKLDLNKHLIPHPLATFFVRVSGNSMTGAGIYEGDLLIVDRSLEPRDGNVVIAVVNGELLVKRLKMRNGQPHLVAEHPDYAPLAITEAMDFSIWGVVKHSIRSL